MDNLNNKKRLRTSLSSSSSFIFNHQPHNNKNNNNNSCNNNCNNCNNCNNIIIKLNNRINQLEIENQNVIKEKESIKNELETINKENFQLLINSIEKESQYNQLLLDIEAIKNENNQLLYISYQQNEQLSNSIQLIKRDNENLIIENQQLINDIDTLRNSFNQFLQVNQQLKQSESEKHEKILMLEIKLDYIKNQYYSIKQQQQQQQQQPFQNQHQKSSDIDNEFKLYQDSIKLKDNIKVLKELLFQRDKQVKELKSNINNNNNNNYNSELSNTVINHLLDQISKLKQINLNHIKDIVYCLINGNEYDVFGLEFKDNCTSIEMKSKLTKQFKELSLLVHPDKCNLLPHQFFSQLNQYYYNLKNNNNNNHSDNTVY